MKYSRKNTASKQVLTCCIVEVAGIHKPVLDPSILGKAARCVNGRMLSRVVMLSPLRGNPHIPRRDSRPCLYGITTQRSRNLAEFCADT